MMSIADDWTLWDPAFLFDKHNCKLKFSLTILNQPLLSKPDLILSLWKRALLHVTVDGGTDRWLEFSTSHDAKELSPELITGDFDSVTPEALQFYSARGSMVVKTPDQNETDFTKALRQISLWLTEKNMEIDAVVVLVETAGRLDHILANLNSLFRSRSLLPSPVFQLASNSVSWLLPPGRHKILVPEGLARGHCSLVPLGEPSRCVTTSGLKWNLDHQLMQFGDLVSTSNAFSDLQGGEVTVETDGTLVWSMEIS